MSTIAGDIPVPTRALHHLTQSHLATAGILDVTTQLIHAARTTPALPVALLIVFHVAEDTYTLIMLPDQGLEAMLAPAIDPTLPQSMFVSARVPVHHQVLEASIS